MNSVELHVLADESRGFAGVGVLPARSGTYVARTEKRFNSHTHHTPRRLLSIDNLDLFWIDQWNHAQLAIDGPFCFSSYISTKPYHILSGELRGGETTIHRL
jgi:hypothetical protein